MDSDTQLAITSGAPEIISNNSLVKKEKPLITDFPSAAFEPWVVIQDSLEALPELKDANEIDTYDSDATIIDGDRSDFVDAPDNLVGGKQKQNVYDAKPRAEVTQTGMCHCKAMVLKHISIIIMIEIKCLYTHFFLLKTLKNLRIQICMFLLEFGNHHYQNFAINWPCKDTCVSRTNRSNN